MKWSGATGNHWFDGDAANARALLGERHYRDGSYSSCFVNPNAHCPVCDASVYYYSNSFGSRVFFDELGYPWPKHACTDRGRNYSVRTPTRDYPALQRRKRGEIAEIFGCLRALSSDPRDRRRAKHGHDPTSVFVVDRCSRRGFTNYLGAIELVGGEGEIAFFKFNSAKVEMKMGDIFSTDGATLTFRDLEADRIEKFEVSSSTVGEFDEARAGATQ